MMPSSRRTSLAGTDDRRAGSSGWGSCPPAVAINDGKKDRVPPIRTVHIPRPELGGEAVAVLVEDEERMVADRLEVAIVGRLLLGAVDWALRAVDIEDHAMGGRSDCLALKPIRY